jgi:hypothetical protein
MVHVLLSLILYAKILNNQHECDCPHCVHPESGCVFTLVITIGGKTFLQELVGQDAGLGETPDGLAHLKVDVSSNNFIRRPYCLMIHGGKRLMDIFMYS